MTEIFFYGGIAATILGVMLLIFIKDITVSTLIILTGTYSFAIFYLLVKEIFSLNKAIFCVLCVLVVWIPITINEGRNKSKQKPNI
jgi:hypothetical protein